MKKLLLFGAIVLLISFFAVIINLSYTQWKHWKGSIGWSYDSKYQELYDPHNIVSVKGVVRSIKKLTIMRRMSDGVSLDLQTNNEILSIHLGPIWFVKRMDIEIIKDDVLEIKGSRITYKSTPTIIASQIKKGNDMLMIRDKNGYPVWSGLKISEW